MTTPQNDLTVRLEEKLPAVGRGTWDQLAHPSVYHGYDWLMARSRYIAGKPKFILITKADSDTLIAGLPCYLVGADSHPGYEPIALLTDQEFIDGLAEGGTEQAEDVSRLACHLREGAPLLRPAISATAPGRAGGISYREGISVGLRREAAELAVEAVEQASLAEGAPAICWMYMLEGQDDAVREILLQRDYTSVAIGAECYLPLSFGNFEDYLASLRSRYRYQALREMRALTEASVRVEEHSAEVLGPELARLEQQWRGKYGRVTPIDRILEEYDGMRSHVGSSLRVFTAHQDNRVLGFTTFLTDRDQWYAGACGFDYSASGLFLYYNLVFYYPLRAAIAYGVRCMRYTQKSYEAKRARGCLLRNVLAFVRLPSEFSVRTRPYLEAVDRTQRARFARIAAMRVSRSVAVG